MAKDSPFYSHFQSWDSLQDFLFIITFLHLCFHTSLTFLQLTSDAPWSLGTYQLQWVPTVANLLSLEYSCVKSCKIRSILPYCRDSKSFQGPDLQQVQTHKRDKIKTDVTLTAMEPHCCDLQNKKKLHFFQTPLNHPAITYTYLMLNICLLLYVSI